MRCNARQPQSAPTWVSAMRPIRGNFRTALCESFPELDRNAVACLLTDLAPQLGVDGKQVPPIPERHEGAAERLSVDGALDLHEAARPEEFDRVGHDDIRP
jgi:hypothetical protein